MSGFSADWLALREPADHAARSERLTNLLAEWLRSRPSSILDLGSGTGSNLRYLAARLPPPQQWLLTDNDPALLARSVHLQADCETRCLDLSTLEPSLFDGRTVVTASALLDLVSDEWMGALAAHCHRAGAAVLFALTYDGRTEYAPHDAGDARVRDLVNRHQQGDKGFGPALGPAATAAAARHFAGHGYSVHRQRTDWRLDSSHAALQKELLEGSARAAQELAPGESAAIDAWLTRRLDYLAAGVSRIVIGHEDLAALPDQAASN